MVADIDPQVIRITEDIVDAELALTGYENFGRICKREG